MKKEAGRPRTREPKAGQNSMSRNHRVALGMISGAIVGGLLSLLAMPLVMEGDEPLLPLLLLPCGTAACALFGAVLAGA
jgi:CBS-domain-containing membrane protein